MTLMFFAAGVAKLRYGGLEWIFSDSFATTVLLKHYDKDAVGDWGLYLVQVPWLCQLLALTSVAIEILAPLALFGRRPWAVLVPLLFGMQVGIAVFMGVHPRSPNFACYSLFVPWTRVGEFIGGVALPSKNAVYELVKILSK